MRSKQKMLEMLDTIQEMFPNAKCELNHRNEFDLLIASQLLIYFIGKSLDIDVSKPQYSEEAMKIYFYKGEL